MTDVAVEFLLNNLIELANEHSHVVPNNGGIKSLKTDLCSIKALLRDSVKKRGMDELIRDIRDEFYEVENLVDAFVTHAISKGQKSRLLARLRKSSSFKLQSIGKRVKEIKNKIEQSSHSLAVVDDGRKYTKSEALALKLENVAGFQAKMKEVIGHLTQQTEELDVITIVGMPGIGKTALARMIDGNESIQQEFPIRIWVNVTSEFREKDILLTMLKAIPTINENLIGESDENNLANLVTSHLESGKFLIILNDMWAINDWDRIRKALPKLPKDGKILITTCNEEIGRHTSRLRQPYKVQPLSETESWELLQLEVFGENKCPPELETVGNLIAKQCDGLPLAVVTMAEILVREDLSCGDDIKARRAAWIETCQRIPEYRNRKFYDILSVHLKNCFLYLAAFPYDSEIPADELIGMWVAEGLIAPQDGLSLEQCGEGCLEDLIRRNMVKVERIKANGKVKMCGIHRTLHEFCKREAGKGREDLFTEIKFSDGVFDHPSTKMSKSHRFSIHSDGSDLSSSNLFFPRARSFFLFSKDQVCLSTELVSSISVAFKVVRVLAAKRLIFTNIPSDVCNLLHLRYLAVSSNMSILPAHFSKLWNIQTLLVNTTSPTLDIKPDILKFAHLRHFKTNASAHLCKVGTAEKGGEKLQSLSTISPESCTEILCSRANYLKKLGIRGNLALLLDENTRPFDNLAAMENLENLMLAHPNPPSKGRLDSLLPQSKFPPTLKSLTLAGTYLEWSQMIILGLVKNLEVLKLKDKAFMGRIWEACDGGFTSLKALHISETDLVIWVASARHFPSLTRLKLRNCDQLQEVPIELADKSFQLLELYETKLAADSAKRFQEEMQRLLKGQNMDVAQFKLSIYPLS